MTAVNPNLQNAEAIAQQIIALTGQLTPAVDAGDADYLGQLSDLKGQILSADQALGLLQGISAADKALLDDLVAGRRTVVEFSGLENPEGWVQPGNTGNSGGGSTKPHGTYTFAPDGTVTTAPAGPYDEYYFYKPVTHTDGIIRFAFEFDLIPLGNALSVSQGLEWEISREELGLEYDGGDQILLKFDGKDNPICFRQYDFTNGWEKTAAVTVPAITAGVPLHILAEYEVDRANQAMIRKAISLNGQRTVLGQSFKAKQHFQADGVTPSTNNHTHVSFQMDTDGHGEGYAIKIANMKLRQL